MRKTKQVHSDPGKKAVMVWSGSATHPSNCALRWCFELTAWHTQDLPGKFEIRRPRPHNWKANSLKGFHQIKNRCYRSLILFSCKIIETCQLQQRVSHTVRSAPPLRPPAAHHSLGFWCFHFAATSGARKASHQRVIVGTSAMGRSLLTLFWIKKNMVVQACCGHLPHHLLHEFHHLCSCFFRQIQRNFGMKAVALLFCLCLVTLCWLLQLLLQ